MSWFVNLVVSLFTTILQGFSSLLLEAGLTIKNVIADNMMAHADVPFGSGTWFDVLPAGRNETVIHTFMGLFWVLGSAALVIALYAMIARIAGANRSSVKRERLRTGAIEMVVAVVLLFAGERLAVSITQVFYDLSMGALSLGATNVPNFSLPSESGNQIATFFNAVVAFIQVVMAVVLYVMYQFRELFLDAWVIFFPVAMVAYAHEKTRGITRLWWTEWVYQMAVPFGQSLVFSFSYAMVNPHDTAALGVADIFTALTGVIGFIASSVYVRKLVGIVGQAFDAPMMGATPGGIAAVATGALAGDAVAGAGITALGKAYGTVGKAAFRTVDKGFSTKARAAIDRAPETHAGMIREGATLDDIMSHHVMAARGADPLQEAGGSGLEGVIKGARGTTAGVRSPVNRAPRARVTTNSGLRVPLPLGASSRTLGAISGLSQGVGETIGGSHMAKWAQTKWDGVQNEGGIVRRGVDHVAPIVSQAVQSKAGQATVNGVAAAAGSVASAGVAAGSFLFTRDPQRRIQRSQAAYAHTSAAVARVGSASMAYQANRAQRMQRMEETRGHLRELMYDHVATQRMGNINPYPYQPADEQWPEGTFTGLTPAMTRYTEAEQGLSHALQTMYRATGGQGSMQRAQEEIKRYQRHWDEERHVPDLHELPKPVQSAYQDAFAAYRPYREDVAARGRVQIGRVQMTAPHEEKRKQDLARAQAFLADARASILARK
ncbi:MAG: hypothetical protein OWT28_02575 [Firmicutes bacterium]|nr:hypothetical protein [Bacillota bacterium]